MTQQRRAAGPLLFARYAYPPNALGLCGPADSAALLEHVAADAGDRGLVRLARQFHGAWPYLSLIAAATGRSDPLDPAVVEAYWVGNRLLERVPTRLLAAHLTERFAHQVGPAWTDPATLAVTGGRAHHNFHVFAISPWVGLLRSGHPDQPLRVLDQCRIAWATVTRLVGDVAEVSCPRLQYDAGRLRLGPAERRRVTWSTGGHVLAGRPAVGDRVAVHWDWVCDVLSARQLALLRHYTLGQLHLVNDALARPSVGVGFDRVGHG